MQAPPEKTAVVVCDAWDAHWCRAADTRMRQLIPAIDQFLTAARQRGMLIVHSPSGTLGFYQEHPARHRVLSACGNSFSASDKHLWLYRNPEHEPPLPIDDSDGGCGCNPRCEPEKVFTRQSAGIGIEDTDIISTDGQELSAIFDQLSIKRVLILGFHLNMCILGRSFGIRQWVQLGQQVELVSDLTDVIYNPACHPFVTTAEALELVISHIETYLCPSVSSSEVLSEVSVR